jgi:hypothetical protein
MTSCAGLFQAVAAAGVPRQEVTFVVQDDKPVGLDGTRVELDDERVVCDAGILVVATLALRLGIEALAGDLVGLRRGRPGAANAGRKVMALVYAMVIGADSIDDCDVLRAGRTGRLLGGTGIGEPRQAFEEIVRTMEHSRAQHAAVELVNRADRGARRDAPGRRHARGRGRVVRVSRAAAHAVHRGTARSRSSSATAQHMASRIPTRPSDSARPTFSRRSRGVARGARSTRPAGR